MLKNHARTNALRFNPKSMTLLSLVCEDLEVLSSPEAGPSAAFSKIGVVTLLFDSCFWNRCLRSAFFVINASVERIQWPNFPVKESCNFRSGFVDFAPNSICDTEWNLFEIMQDRNKGFWSINRNHQPFGYSALIHGGSTCLFFRQTRVCDAIFFPVIHIQLLYQSVLDFSW